MEPGPITLELGPEPGRFRSSEGSFVALADGRILLVYTKFTGGYKDNAGAEIVSRVSADGGRTWRAEDAPVVALEGRSNVMSASLLRLADGRVLLGYLVKDTNRSVRPRVRFSADECRTWSGPVDVTTAPGAFIVNNDRIVQLRSGRLIVPAAYRPPPESDKGSEWICRATCFLSDDAGRTWRRSRSVVEIGDARSGSGLQEPGVVELADGALWMWSRTDMGCQYGLGSLDAGETWSAAERTEFISPLGPMSVKRIPGSGALLALYNDHSGRFPFDEVQRGRQPLVSAISRDEGKTWGAHKLVEGDLSRGYHYTAIHFTDDAHVLLGYCAGPRGPGFQLNTLRVRRIPQAWFES
jgi:sialidase-1